MIRALATLEWHYARHNVLAVLRSPARLALWVPYSIALAYFAFARFSGVRHHAASEPLGAATATGIAGAYLALFGVAIATAAMGRIQSFRCPAEATLMSNAGLRPLAISVWLQLRKIALGWTRSLGGLLYVLLIVPSHATGFALLRSFVATILAFAVILSAELPAFLVSRGRANVFVRAFGWALVAFGAAYALAGFGGATFRGPLVAATHVDPGAALAAIASGGTLGLLVPVAIFAAFVAIVAARGNDALPELYAASAKRASLLTRSARGATTSDRATDGRRPHLRPARVPRGPLALVWKDWVTFRRANGVVLFGAGALAWAAFGALAALATVRYQDRALLGTFVIFEAVIVIFWAPTTAAAGLADDLGKPLFWLSPASLRARLVAWSFGRAWRGGFVVAIGPLVACAIVREPALAAMTVPLAFVAYWSLQILGIGTYAAFPNPVDSRGPIGLVRLIASFVYVLLPCVPAFVVFALHGPAPLAAATFACGLALEAWGVVELAASRFASRGAVLATIARAT